MSEEIFLFVAMLQGRNLQQLKAFYKFKLEYQTKVDGEIIVHCMTKEEMSE